jgi:hypothetical protein
MDPGVFLVPVGGLVTIVGAIYFATARIIRLRASLRQPSSEDVTTRLHELERGFDDLQQQLAETQERLDFAERMLSKARDDRQIGP